MASEKGAVGKLNFVKVINHQYHNAYFMKYKVLKLSHFRHNNKCNDKYDGLQLAEKSIFLICRDIKVILFISNGIINSYFMSKYEVGMNS